MFAHIDFFPDRLHWITWFCFYRRLEQRSFEKLILSKAYKSDYKIFRNSEFILYSLQFISILTFLFVFIFYNFWWNCYSKMPDRWVDSFCKSFVSFHVLYRLIDWMATFFCAGLRFQCMYLPFCYKFIDLFHSFACSWCC